MPTTATGRNPNRVSRHPHRSLGALAVCALFIAMLSLCGCGRKQWTYTPPSAPLPNKDFDVRFDSMLDPNGAARNVDWAPQRDGRIPDPDACNNGQPYTPECTQNNPFRDQPNIGHEAFCVIGKAISGSPFEPFFGHADWMLAQYDGSIGWLNFGDDFDYDLLLVPGALPPGTDKMNRHGITKNNNHVGDDKNLPQYIEMEWNSDETDDAFSVPSSWWAQFKDAAQAKDRQELARLIHPSDATTLACGTALGLFGLDCDHGCRSEIHPVYALAIQRKEEPADNEWSVLVRNWGTGGFCSQYNDELAATSLSLLLPYTSSEPPTNVEVQDFLTTTDSGPGVQCPRIYFDNGKTILNFTLPPPQNRAVAAFSLKIQWPARAQPVACTTVKSPEAVMMAHEAPPPHAAAAPPPDAAHPSGAPAAPGEEKYQGNGEEYLEHLVRGLSREQRLDLKKNLSAIRGRRARGIVPPPPHPIMGAAASCNGSVKVSTGTPPLAVAVSIRKLQKDQRKRDRDDAMRAYLCHEYQSGNMRPPVGTQAQLNQACKGVK